MSIQENCEGALCIIGIPYSKSSKTIYAHVTATTKWPSFSSVFFK